VFSAGELYIYLGTFLAIVVTGLGAPFPEEIPIVTAGVLAGKGQTFVQWWLLLPICIIGVVVGDGLLYILGRTFGTKLLDLRLVARLMPPEKRRRIEHNFHIYGVKILLFARLLPGIRSPIFIMAGIMRLPVRRFLLADGIYAIPGVTLLFFLAFWFTNSFMELVVDAEHHVRHAVILGAVVLVAIYLIIHFLRRPILTGDPKELPLMGDQAVVPSPEPPARSMIEKKEELAPTGRHGHQLPERLGERRQARD
jgi:membrane protein DedA with SNARE-associated domain